MIYATTDFYNQGLVRRYRSTQFVFGDNLHRNGYGGQAIIRDAPNARGIATKRSCAEAMTGTPADFEAVIRDIRNVEAVINSGAMVLFPILKNGNSSLGCGLADLPRIAPHLYGMINDWFRSLPSKKVKLNP